MDLQEIFQNIESADVICLHFPYLRKTLVVDLRTDVEDPPLVKLVPMAKSVDERLRSLRRLRPRFTQPEKVTILPWPRYVESLTSLGVWGKLIGRVANEGHPELSKTFDQVMAELRQMETAEFAAAITGKQYHTIWEAPTGEAE